MNPLEQQLTRQLLVDDVTTYLEANVAVEEVERSVAHRLDSLLDSPPVG